MSSFSKFTSGRVEAVEDLRCDREHEGTNQGCKPFLTKFCCTENL